MIIFNLRARVFDIMGSILLSRFVLSCTIHFAIVPLVPHFVMMVKVPTRVMGLLPNGRIVVVVGTNKSLTLLGRSARGTTFA